MSRPSVSVAGVRERDLDLLMLEEFVASSGFMRQFALSALQLDTRSWTVERAAHSVADSHGESDLLVDMKAPDGRRIRLLIENKIGAGMQPTQAQRYRRRAAIAKKRGKCDEAYTILVAPERYFGTQESRRGFDGTLTYERVLDLIKASSETLSPSRRAYKVYLLEQAIEKGILGYQSEADSVVSEFWTAYYQLATAAAPRLQMRRPGSKPSGSSFIYFKPRGLPKRARICHKLGLGVVDLQLRGMARRIAELRNAVGERLASGMRIDVASGSAAIRILTPIIDMSEPFEDQTDAALEGIRAAQRLLKWGLEQRAELDHALATLDADQSDP